MEDKKIKKLVMSSMGAALCCVATMVIRIPTIGTNGYVNIGDAVVLICAWIIGGVYGAIAAGVGSAMADLLASYVTYVPGTFIIKFVMAFVAYWMYKATIKMKINRIISYCVSAIFAEIIMVAGYFIYESFILGYGIAAVSSVGSNILQGATCIILGVTLICVLESTKIVARLKSEL